MEEETKIKKGLNIYWYYWTVVAFVGFWIVDSFATKYTFNYINIELMISVVTFLFGFLISITFSMLLTRTSSLKVALSTEAGRLVSLYLLSKNLGKEFSEKIRERIDSYTMDTLREYASYEVGRESNYGMYDDINCMELKTQNQRVAADSFLYILGEFQPTRESLEYITKKRIEWSLKLVNYLLGIILILLLFLNRGDEFTNTLFIILSTVVIFILLIVEDYDNLRIGDYTVNISNSEQIFDLIEKDRYYPEEIMSRVKLEKGRDYRIGIYDTSLKKERVFRITYNPKLNVKIPEIISKLKKKNNIKLD
ncbi:MAG: hypothetical protein WC533_04130 [Candidatus Pacearchaeota archaeon]